MVNESIIQVAQRGVFTLPKRLRDTYGVKVGDIYTIIDLGNGSFMLSPRRLSVDALADDVRAALEERGETLETMLKRLRDIRESHGRVKAQRVP